ncbi:MAG: Ig-like domain-containing protein, partial [Candidatus Margulisbacteria bacterium]|nr:Ig-like domain-containing protein [Candidatus Margulisiibacteriota bacterium]
FTYDPSLAGAGTDAVYNYSFNYNGYHFIFLDSVRENNTGHINATWLAGDLAANASKESFIFLHYTVTLESVAIPEEILREVTDTPSGPIDMTKIDLDNRSAFLSLVSSHEANIAGIFMGHIHDNSRYYQNNINVPFVRTASTIQFPVGINVYKVYSNGFQQMFYKLPYYSEYAREFITPEAGYSDDYWEMGALGSTYDRNFTVLYSEVKVPPAVKTTAPAGGSTNVALNQPVIITFTKQMLTTDTQNAVTISPNLPGLSYTWSNLDTTLTIAHSNFTASTAYTITVGTGARSKDGMAFASASATAFTSGTSVAPAPPTASIDGIVNDITDDPTPTLTGIATDETSTIASVEYRVASQAGSNWRSCTPLDGAFNSNIERFTFTITPELIRGLHEVQIRCTNAAGVTTQSNFTSYSFYYVGFRPEIGLKADGTEIINGDPIKSNPSFEVTVATDKGLNLNNLKFYLDQTAVTPTLTIQKNNSTLTYAYYHPTMTDGSHSVRAEATDNQGNLSSKEAIGLLVQIGGDLNVYGAPLNYPNPFDPGGGSTTISYSLSKPANITLSIFDLGGNLIAKKNYSANQPGGKAGYNEVPWDGKSDSGVYVGNGIYIYLIMTDGKVAQNGKGKITVFKR